MKKTIFLSLWMSLAFLCKIGAQEESPASPKKTICLNMIVKNESKVIRRCLESVKDYIDYWVIVDTGSTDGTQEIIKTFLKGIPGDLYERPWVDFGHNRSEALSYAKGKGDYLLFMDADEKLVYSGEFSKNKLDKDYYYVAVRGSTSDFLSYNRFLLVDNRLNWEWKDILHEYLVTPPEAKTYEVLSTVTCFTDSDGFRAEDPKKYYKDAAILEKALEKDPTNSRYMFYLAQSYCNAKEYELALKAYEKRASMLYGWADEIFWSLYGAAYLQEAMGKSPDLFIANYCKAYQFNPARAEPLYRMVNYYNSIGNYTLAYAVAKTAVTIPLPQDLMYIQGWIYDYGALCSLSESALFLGKYEEASSLLQEVLLKKTVPEDVVSRVKKNLAIAISKQIEKKKI